jgi:hypothetical protein
MPLWKVAVASAIAWKSRRDWCVAIGHGGTVLTSRFNLLAHPAIGSLARFSFRGKRVQLLLGTFLGQLSSDVIVLLEIKEHLKMKQLFVDLFLG